MRAQGKTMAPRASTASATAAATGSDGPVPMRDARAFQVGPHLWALIEGDNYLWIRLNPGEIPADYHSEIDPESAAMLEAIGQYTPKTWLPVERGDVTTIGGVTIDERLFAKMIDLAHPGARWCIWNDWLLAKNASGEAVVLWQMPTEAGLFEAFMLELEPGVFWAVSGKFCCRINPPKEHVATIRKSASKADNVRGRVLEMIAKARRGQLVQARREGSFGWIGTTMIPGKQLTMIEGNAGTGDLTWRWTGPLDPVVAFLGETPVGLVMPIPASHHPRAEDRPS